MRGLATKLNIAVGGAYTWSVSPVCAHVKWFLSRPENELLKEPKPNLFTQLSWENVIPTTFAFVFMYFIDVLNKRFSNWRGNKLLVNWAKRNEFMVNFFMAMTLGIGLIYCGFTRTLLVPNFIICSHCPQWLPAAEIAVGVLLTFGLFSRLCGLAILGLLYMAICKHGLAECLDALPIFGLAIYFMIAGRSKFSLDYALAIDRLGFDSLIPFAHRFVRQTMGLGLIILALDEKLLHPQLAMDLLQHSQALNPWHQIGLSNEMFVLLTGLAELMLGVSVFHGYFPRLAVFLLLVIFSATTTVFGVEEFFGHAPCYGIILSIMLWGAGAPAYAFNFGEYCKNCLVRFLPKQKSAKIAY